MASLFSHTLVALAVGQASINQTMPARFWALSVLCSILPDADVIGFAFGIEYGDLLGHRGLTHSLSFALFISLVIARVWFPAVTGGTRAWWLLLAYFFLVTASHGMLDAMTDGGLGVAFFAPFDNTRYFLPWRPVKVSPIGIKTFFNSYGLQVLMSEIVWIWIPGALMVLGVKAGRKAYRWNAKRGTMA